jgi:hypothetical protein
MGFIEENERLILVDQQVGRVSADGKALLHAAGIKTVIAEGILSWHKIEPEKGVFHWEYTDRYVEETLGTGMKLLLAMYGSAPAWVPTAFHDGVHRCQWGDRERWIDPLHSLAVLEEANFILRAIERYSRSGVCCYPAIPQGGSRLMPPSMSCSEKQAAAIMLRRQSPFALYNEDLWTSLHPAAIPDGVGNEHADAIYEAMEKAFPNHNHWRLLWAFFASAGCQWQLDDRYWVGAEYARNVAKNARNLWGARGMIMAPSDWRDGPVEVNDFVVSQVKEALGILGQ